MNPRRRLMFKNRARQRAQQEVVETPKPVETAPTPPPKAAPKAVEAEVAPVKTVKAAPKQEAAAVKPKKAPSKGAAKKKTTTKKNS